MTEEKIKEMAIEAGLENVSQDTIQVFARMIENTVKDEMRPLLKDMQDLLNNK
jgi:hypothetical protein